ncbi:coiled-coil alpha-helical rod protein 1-like [Acropora muricata]|uniref:coiled-coil alpha-helical rod protein 1-like n=1 Tax=Acropora muricata TaxID=159855 RepID=UPI0034E4022E
MAGTSSGTQKAAREKFLSPSYFKVSRPSIPPRKEDLCSVKLLPPAEYNLVKDKDASIAQTAAEMKKLSDENHQLREQLKTSKEQELRLETEIRKEKILQQKERVDDALDLKRMAELQEENLALQAEVRKLSNLTAKLRVDVKEVKINLETDLERSEGELEKANSYVKELRTEIRQKEEIFELEKESLEKRSNKQAAAIKTLKLELNNAEEQVKIDRKGFEDVLRKNEFDKYEQVRALEERLSVCEVKYSQELQEMREEISKKEQIQMQMGKDLSSKEKDLKSLTEELKTREHKFSEIMKEQEEKMKSNQLTFDKGLAQLKNELEKEVFSHQKEVDGLTATLQNKDEELKMQVSVVDQLRAYIGENLPNTQIEKLQQENEEARRNMEISLQENESLRSTVELLNVRLSSLNDILSIQETELLKFQAKFAKGAGSQDDGFLTKWREKLFALLVQLKSQEIIHEKENRDCRAQVKHLMLELEESEKNASMLALALADKKAQHQIEVNKNMALQRQLKNSQQNETRLKNTVTDFQNSLSKLQEVAEGTDYFMRNVASQMDDALRKLPIFSQRINFACGRIKFLEGLIKHREEKLRTELTITVKEGADNMQSKSDETGISETEPGLSYQQLASEVKHLTNERDHLLAQSRRESEILERNKMALKAQFEEQLQQYTSRISQLESLLKDERERGAVVSEKLQKTQGELSERLETIEEMKSTIAKHKDKAEKDLDKILHTEQARFAEEFAKLERQLNDIRREHTKAVVAQRQAEGQVEREKEKWSSQLALQQKEHEMKLEKCHMKARELEKERNMLMATMRQEGFKVPRLRPKEFTVVGKGEEKENMDQIQPFNKKTMKTCRSKDKLPAQEKRLLQSNEKLSSYWQNEPTQSLPTAEEDAAEEMNLREMTSVLKDLHSLSTALLTMEKENGEDSQISL